MHGALISNFHQARPLFVAEITGDFNFAVDLIDFPLAGFAVSAVISMDFFVPQIHRDPL